MENKGLVLKRVIKIQKFFLGITIGIRIKTILPRSYFILLFGFTLLCFPLNYAFASKQLSSFICFIYMTTIAVVAGHKYESN